MYTKFEKNNEENAFIRDGYICSDKVYRCKRDIVCSNGIFSKGGLVMLEGADDKGIIEIADFAEISRAVVSEHADDYRCGYYCGYTDNGLDTFRVDPKRISNFF